MAAFLTVSRLDVPVESLDDLGNDDLFYQLVSFCSTNHPNIPYSFFSHRFCVAKQYKILYAPINGSAAMTYFQRMSQIEGRFYEIWKDMSLNDSLTPVERSKLAVWDYPVSDKYTKMWQAMQEAGLPNTLEQGLLVKEIL